MTSEKLETKRDLMERLDNTDYRGICSEEGQKFRSHPAKVGEAYFEMRMPIFDLDKIEDWQAHYGENLTEEFIVEAVAAQLGYKADTAFKEVILANGTHAEAQAAADEYRPGQRGAGGRTATPSTITNKIVERAKTDTVYRGAAMADLEKKLEELKEIEAKALAEAEAE